MLKYPSIALMSLAWMVGVALPDIGLSSIIPVAFGQVYGWGPASQGYVNAALLIGSTLGEVMAGRISDMV